MAPPPIAVNRDVSDDLDAQRLAISRALFAIEIPLSLRGCESRHNRFQ
jgi:hypothetical protein